MPAIYSNDNDFLNKITEFIKENISNEQFGVSELAQKTGMSRSNLLRKIKKLTQLSASQFINQVRLQQAMALLKQNSLNVSEVSYEVGFSSTSYFIKCFREYYGFPPGEALKREVNENNTLQTKHPGKKRRIVFIGITSAAVLLAMGLFLFINPQNIRFDNTEKSIAVLPFKNDSNDSTNVYIINGLMESILNNLQKIEDLRVISRTSVEKYRNATKTIPEMGKELNVNYFIEGSGQKIGDQILLHIQLIEAKSDKHLWAEEYSREAKDIFSLQMDVAKNIADKIQAVITPEEEKQINKVPTEDLVAYDYFLKGLDLFHLATPEGLEEAIVWFKKAIEQDQKFARAYADIAMSYYYLDIFQAEKKYSDQINHYADMALLYDSQLPQSLLAKAMFYMNTGENEQAVPYLENALEYNPNSALIINFLSDFYANHIPNTAKYLEYALKGIQLDIAANDSVTASFIYLHVSNAFIQTGFIDEAERYINKSLDYNPDNLYSEYVKAYILYAENRDLLQTKELLIKAFRKDTTRLDILQEIGKICYYLRDYKTSWAYYKPFIDVKKAMHLDIYPFENAKIAVVCDKLGLTEISEKLFQDYLHSAENDNSVYKHISLSVYYSYKGNTKKALEHLRLFSQQDDYYYWILPFLEIDPLVDKIKELPEFKKIFRTIENKFRNNHKQIKASLKKKKLI